MKKASVIQAEATALAAELAELQAQCAHKEQHIRWCPRDKNFRWECKECLARLAYPSITGFALQIRKDRREYYEHHRTKQ